jgi:hypothetical protein
MSNPPVFRRVEGLPFQKVDAQVVVVVPRSRAVHLLNETATRVWELLEPGATVDGLVEALVDEFEVDPAEARRDVEAVLSDMRQKDIVTGEGA